MTRLQKIIAVFIAAALLTTGAYAFYREKSEAGPKNGTPDDKLVVAASIFPLADIVRQVGGEKVQVISILAPGMSEHTYEPTPLAVKSVQKAAMFIKIGYGLDDWTDKIAQSVDESLPIKDVSDGIVLPESEEEHGDEDVEKGVGFPDASYDPHYFLQLENGAIIAETVAGFLSAADSKNAVTYLANAERYAKTLREEDAIIKQKFAFLPNKKIVTFHDAWYYFAKHYGLEITGTFEPFAGREPSPQYLVDFIKQIREDEIKVLFTEPQFSSEAISQIADNLGIRLGVLDPIGGTAQTNSYLNLIKYNAETIYDALSQ
ncbi:MAG: hypothetical protein A3I29_00585 [Candidatus Magasanikbacteria bacterium RIFCSPLOWO2_02_FULL_44_11]|uniref:ABC transporter substrate-binding protein n=2 Tax=Candidatus Magasanikiibacteriota TaxID=1752731 RepID=A0A1F6N934_9BACT|nr:MAG: hypothetical protein A3D53_03830 [Candidatus Magasanikbacteria bacterium RIFCSPHIGHO2_02_FULL_45_10]OGH80432.1 MAG: hypothetical protein A3I29_00585 [Candidatus Magasanikbacteria bacterium RIFCSPLOWO2_02_FULL_44_11]